MTLGPLMIDVAGTSLDEEDRALLAEPAVGGVILFTRNFESREQLSALTAEIHALRKPPLLIAVDQEGGRVQRFRDGFTALPPAHLIGRQHELDRARARRLAEQSGYCMASELLACGVDISFAPVLDLARGISEVIGDRAFHRDPEVVGELGQAVVRGMREAGMVATGKHFPGHGAVAADSHVSLPVDRRFLEDIEEDIAPFARMIRAGIPALMLAHVVYPTIDDLPASLSVAWVDGILRTRLGFRGVVISDDLSMAAAASIGDVVERGRRALRAGCDLVLVCNDRPGASELVRALHGYSDPVGQVRLARMHGKPAAGRGTPGGDPRLEEAVAQLGELQQKPSFDLKA